MVGSSSQVIIGVSRNISLCMEAALFLGTLYQALHDLDATENKLVVQNIVAICLIALVILVLITPCLIPKFASGTGHCVGGLCRALCKTSPREQETQRSNEMRLIPTQETV